MFFAADFFASTIPPDNTVSHVMTLEEPLDADFAREYDLPSDADIEKVFVTGFFSDWSTNNPAYALDEVTDGIWKRNIRLPVGDTQYKFVVYLSGDSTPYWLPDPSNDSLVSDSFGAVNSLIVFPDYRAYLTIIKFASLVIFAFLIAYFGLEKFLLWLLNRRMPVARKIVFATITILFFSNLLLLSYQLLEYRQFVKHAVVDAVHSLHLGIQKGQTENHLLLRNPEIKRAMKDLLWQAKTRVEKNQSSILQVTVSDLALLTNKLELVHIQNRKQNTDLQNQRVSQAGYESLEEYYMQGVFGPLLDSANTVPMPNFMTAHPAEKISKIETSETYWARQFLGFSNLLVPIDIHGKRYGYYAAAIQVKMYGGEIKRVIFVNLVLIAMIVLLSYTMLSSVAQTLTISLVRLSQWTQRINQADFSGSVKIQTQDEVQTLADNFAIMQDSLRDSFDKIKSQNEQLSKAAYTDLLTGLGNKARLLKDLSDTEQNLIVLELIEFDRLVDFLGENFMAELTIRIQRRLAQVAERIDHAVLYKIAPNQFAVLINNLGSSQLTNALNALVQSVNDSPVKVKQLALKFSLSAGVCISEYATELPTGTLDKAMQAVRVAKTKFDKQHFYNPSMEPKRDLSKNVSLINRIRDSLEKGLLVPFYQPIVSTRSKRIFAYECLARIVEPDNVVISPNEFIPAAKYCGLYHSISHSMFEQSARACVQNDINITLNLSALDVEDNQSNQFLSAWLDTNKDILHRITFEINETDKIEEYDQMKAFIDKVSKLGCRVALDDFGAGYSNFTHLLSLNIDYIKIDGSLIKNINTDPNSQLITKAIVECAKALEIKTVAEYVHCEAVYEFVKKLGIDYCQGYYFGVPDAQPIKAT
ncbi:hypothetical protein GCM10009114_18160 [Aliiglaciecola litoralis]|uniref:EAL domain-containing protein n=1 Tax=Aliiglaciecola litoralis TaxID=582857 RepID=A0ABN1LI62_9ALTE